MNDDALGTAVEQAYAELGNIWKVGDRLGIAGQKAWAILNKRGVKLRNPKFTAEEKERLLRDYDRHANTGTLDALAAEMGRTRQFICRQAGKLGLTNRSRARPYWVEPTSKRIKEWIAEHGHARGMLGKKHSAETKARISKASAETWRNMSEDRIAEIADKAAKTRIERGILPPMNREGATWKAGWREIGGVRKYYRSRWEANYARYLEWLKGIGQVVSWEHEPKTFWFSGIKRGARSYLPDFRVVEVDGSEAYHEVKGWMDARSKTKIKRMAKYHPDVTLIVIDSAAYKEINKWAAGFIEGWE